MICIILRRGLSPALSNLIARAQHTITIIGFTNRGPTFTAHRVPICAPANEAIAIANASGQIMTPFEMKIDNEPKLHDAFASFAKLIALIIPSPASVPFR